MRRKLQIIAFALSLVFVLRSQAQTAEPIFPKGSFAIRVFPCLDVTAGDLEHALPAR